MKTLKLIKFASYIALEIILCTGFFCFIFDGLLVYLMSSLNCLLSISIIWDISKIYNNKNRGIKEC